MLEPLLGSTSKERVLIYLHAREIADAFQASVTPIQNQLEGAGVIWCEPQGCTRVCPEPPLALPGEVAGLAGACADVRSRRGCAITAAGRALYGYATAEATFGTTADAAAEDAALVEAVVAMPQCKRW